MDFYKVIKDIYKQNDEDENLALMNIYFKEHVNEAKALYHQYLGAYFVSSVLLYHDIKVYDAIYHHTTGTCTNKIAMIIYIADKIDPSRVSFSSRGRVGWSSQSKTTRQRW